MHMMKVWQDLRKWVSEWVSEDGRKEVGYRDDSATKYLTHIPRLQSPIGCFLICITSNIPESLDQWLNWNGFHAGLFRLIKVFVFYFSAVITFCA